MKYITYMPFLLTFFNILFKKIYIYKLNTGAPGDVLFSSIYRYSGKEDIRAIGGWLSYSDALARELHDYNMRASGLPDAVYRRSLLSSHYCHDFAQAQARAYL